MYNRHGDKTSIISRRGDSCNCLRAKPREMPEQAEPKSKKPVGLRKHSPKQRKKTNGIDNENKPATCASSDESWQAHQGPSSEQLGTFEQLGKSKPKLLPAGTGGQAP